MGKEGERAGRCRKTAVERDVPGPVHICPGLWDPVLGAQPPPRSRTGAGLLQAPPPPGVMRAHAEGLLESAEIPYPFKEAWGTCVTLSTTAESSSFWSNAEWG